jgi:hypothetical protein
LKNNDEIRFEDLKNLINAEDPVWRQLKSLVLCEDREFELDELPTPGEVSDFIAHGAKASVKVEHGFVVDDGDRWWFNDGEDRWRLEEDIEERENST